MFNWLQIAIGAIPALVVAYLLHAVDIGIIEAKHTRDLSEQKAALEASCQADKKITKEANDALQNKLYIIADKLKSAKRMQPSCILPATGSSNHTSNGNGYAGQNGISANWLREYAAECETYRQERITLEGFIQDVWNRK